MNSSVKNIRVGDIFKTNNHGEVVVISVKNCNDITVSFLNHPFEKIVSSKNLRNGRIRNPYNPVVKGVGYVGLGIHSPTINRQHTDSYKAWKSMLTRCYCEKYASRNNNYSDVTVCEEWHNFQNFAEWYTNHEFYGRGYHLDKDLIVEGNKAYSPETCCLVPQEINSILCDRGSDRGALPIGVSFDKVRRKYGSKISMNGDIVFLGRYETPEEAHKAYVVAKEAHVKRRAEHWKPLISKRVYDSLLKWRVSDD